MMPKNVGKMRVSLCRVNSNTNIGAEWHTTLQAIGQGNATARADGKGQA
jgi:hypothetical protein